MTPNSTPEQRIAELEATIAHLEAQLAEARQWTPMLDEKREVPDWADKGNYILDISADGSELTIWHSSNYDGGHTVRLPDDIRMFRHRSTGRSE